MRRAVYDFLLFVHVLFAFTAVSATTLFWMLIAATQPGRMLLTPGSAMTLGRIGGIAIGLGMIGALVFGVWLAIYVDGYELWDTWIAVSIVLWLIGGVAGQRAGAAYQRAAEGGDVVALRRQGLVFHTVSTAALVVILVMMIFKPGA